MLDAVREARGTPFVLSRRVVHSGLSDSVALLRVRNIIQERGDVLRLGLCGSSLCAREGT